MIGGLLVLRVARGAVVFLSDTCYNSPNRSTCTDPKQSAARALGLVVIDDAQHLADPVEAVRVKHRHLPGLEKGLEARS